MTERVEAAGGRLCRGFPRWLSLFLGKGTLAITLGRRIYLGEPLLARDGEEIDAIVAHELEHVRQFARVGLVAFAWRYARDYVGNRRRGMSAYEAYEAIPFEVEARVAENRFRRGERGEDVRTA
ncbi:MAG: eCIS core domain-containing protein [Thermoanaerobaculia bacterium]